MQAQEVMLQAMAKKITWFQAAEIVGIRPAHGGRWERHEESGFRGRFDWRRGKPSPKPVPRSVLERVSERYRDKNFDGNLRHFHEKLAREHPIRLGYSWVRRRAAGLGVSSAAVAGNAVAHRRQPPAVVSGRTLVRLDRDLDDPSSAIYYAQLEESTMTVTAGLREAVQRKGVFCASIREIFLPRFA